MASEIVDLECPGCAATVSINTRFCPYCQRPIVIKTINNIAGLSQMDINKQVNSYRKAMVNSPDNAEMNLSIAFCYMRLKLYDKAISCFEKALIDNFDNADAYYYAAISLLKGKRAFLASRETINKIIEYIDAANMIEPKGIFYYFLAYIKCDYFERKCLNSSPSYRECISNAVNIGLSNADVIDMYNLLGVERPAQI